MTAQQELLEQIESFLSQGSMAESTFGRLAVNDGKLVRRLRDGGRVWPETAEKVAAFIRQMDSGEAA